MINKKYNKLIVTMNMKIFFDSFHLIRQNKVNSKMR